MSQTNSEISSSSSDPTDIQIIVIDPGSYHIKTGWAGDDFPRSIIPPIIGCPLLGHNNNPELITTKLYIGPEALEMKKNKKINIKYPIDEKTGIITDWNDMEEIWNYIFEKELKINHLKEISILFIEPPNLYSQEIREKIISIMFENFHIPAFCLVSHPVMALSSTGKTTGIVVDCGENSITISPIFEEKLISKYITRLNFGGKDIEHYLCKIFHERGYSFSKPNDDNTLHDIIEKISYVALDFEADMKIAETTSTLESDYLVEEQRCVITIGNERFRCGEVLFQPNLIENQSQGIHHAIYNTIRKCESENISMTKSKEEIMIFDVLMGSLPSDLIRIIILYYDPQFELNIMLCGGTSLFKGLTARLEKELTILLAFSSLKLKFISSAERKYSAWAGGSMLGSLDTLKFQKMCITKKEFDDNGPKIIHQKNNL